MKLKILSYTARFVFILCIPLLLLSVAIGIAFNTVALYEYGFDEYDVTSATGLARSELVKSAETLISYFNSGEEYIDLTVEGDGVEFELFTREESIHMKDVKGLVRLDYGILLVTLIYVLLYTAVCLYRRNQGRHIAWLFLYGGAATLVLVFALWLGSLQDFDSLFHRFHLLAFTNDFWSAEGYMVLMFPGDFWYDATMFCVIGMAIMAAVMAIASGVYLYFKK